MHATHRLAGAPDAESWLAHSINLHNRMKDFAKSEPPRVENALIEPGN